MALLREMFGSTVFRTKLEQLEFMVCVRTSLQNMHDGTELLIFLTRELTDSVKEEGSYHRLRQYRTYRIKSRRCRQDL